jgi:sarcosine oxidase
MFAFDSVVVGLGAMGSAAAYHLAQRGDRVLGLEQFSPTHGRGSSHGRSRIYRLVQFEGSEYVPLAQRALQLWKELETETNSSLLRETGGLVLGRPSSEFVRSATRSAIEHHLEHRVLDSGEMSRRFPQFRVREDEVGLWDPRAGTLFPERCIVNHCIGASGNGAELRYGEAALSWTDSGSGLTVKSARGTYQTKTLVVTAGPWMRRFLADLELPLEVEQQFVCWFPPTEPSRCDPGRMPVFIWDRGPEGRTYGVPDFGDGVKVGSWQGKKVEDPDSTNLEGFEDCVAPVRAFAREALPGIVARESDWTSCLYTNTPDLHFMVGKHPHHDRVVFVSACSGHGFKFASAIGEIVADLSHEGRSPHLPGNFEPRRFDSSVG